MSRPALYDVFQQDEIIAGLKSELAALQQMNEVQAARIQFLEHELTGLDCQSAKPNTRLKTHCYQGHAYTPENTKLDSRGFRVCRTCCRENGRIRNQRFRQRQAIANSEQT